MSPPLSYKTTLFIEGFFYTPFLIFLILCILDLKEFLFFLSKWDRVGQCIVESTSPCIIISNFVKTWYKKIIKIIRLFSG